MSDKEPTVMFWMGQRVDELSRDELLEVVRHLGRDIQRMRDERNDEREMHRMFQEARIATRPLSFRLFDALFADRA